MAAARKVTKRVRLAQKRRKRNILLTISGIVLMILAYAGIGWGLTHDAVAITTVAVSGNTLVESGKIEEVVHKELKVTRKFLLYGGTIFTYNKKRIVSEILSQYPRFESVTVEAKNISTLEVVITERAPVAQWCNGAELPECYLVDGNGTIFERIGAPRESLVIYKGDVSGEVLRQSLLRNMFTEMHDFVARLQTEISIDVTEVHLFEGEAEIISSTHPKLKVNRDESLERTVSYVQITLDSQEYKELATPETEPKYIDLRFGNRVYYK